MARELSGTVDEKDGTLTVRDSGGKEVRYVKESDLVAVKESRKSKEDVAKEVELATATAIAEANAKLDTEKTRALQAEAKVSSLEEEIAKGGVDSAELAKAKAELEAAKKSSETLGNKHLELRRSVIIATYGVPKETVASKDLAALDLYEEALKAVIGDKKLGNFAIGGGGGASTLQGKSPMELAVEAYSHSK